MAMFPHICLIFGFDNLLMITKFIKTASIAKNICVYFVIWTFKISLNAVFISFKNLWCNLIILFEQWYHRIYFYMLKFVSKQASIADNIYFVCFKLKLWCIWIIQYILNLFYYLFCMHYFIVISLWIWKIVLFDHPL